MLPSEKSKEERFFINISAYLYYSVVVGPAAVACTTLLEFQFFPLCPFLDIWKHKLKQERFL